MDNILTWHCDDIYDETLILIGEDCTVTSTSTSISEEPISFATTTANFTRNESLFIIAVFLFLAGFVTMRFLFNMFKL